MAKARRKKDVRRPEIEILEDRTTPSLTISGFVYHDVNNDGIYDKTTEQPFANSTIQLKNATGVIVGTTTTNALGYYEFTRDQSINPVPNTKVQTITFDKTSTNFSLGKVANQFDPSLGTLQSITIQHNGTITSEILVENTSTTSTSTITGTVSGNLTLNGPGFTSPLTLSQNAGTFNAAKYDGNTNFSGPSGQSFGEKSATGSAFVTLTGAAMTPYIGTGTVTITEDGIASSTASGGGNLVVQLISSGSGSVTITYNYIASDALKPGDYTVFEITAPPGTTDGKESRNGIVLGHPINTDFIPVTLVNTNAENNNFGELKPASLSGFVYEDVNKSGVKDGADRAISGAIVTLTGTDDTGAIAAKTATTDATGFYQFANLRPGNYTLTETQPNLVGSATKYADGADNIGTPGGNTGNDVFTNINLKSGVDGQNNNFGELMPPANLSGFVYIDANDNGIKEAGELGIPGAVVTLTGTDDIGPLNITVTTNAAGRYEFPNLRPGLYAIAETQPAGFNDGKDTIGTPGGTSDNDRFFNINLFAGVQGVDNNFGEKEPENADIGIVKSANPLSVLVGSNFTYSLQITNYGKTTAKDVVMTDVLPAGVIFVSASGPGWTINNAGNVITATLPTLAVGATSTISMTVQAPLVPGSYTNPAEVTSKTPDNNPNNNKSTVTTTVYSDPGTIFPKSIPPLVTVFSHNPIIGKDQLIGTDTTPANAHVAGQFTFIDGMYRSLTGRPPDAGTLFLEFQQLQAGMPRENLVAKLWNSDENRGRQADALYQAFYSRNPNAGEKTAMIAQLKAGVSELDVAANFLNSNEYLNAHPGSGGIVSGAYQDILGRLPDTTTQLLEVQALNNQPLNSWVQNLVRSTEALNQVVDEGYRQILRRPATAGEMQFWGAQLKAGIITPGVLMQKLLASEEFFQLALKVAVRV